VLTGKPFRASPDKVHMRRLIQHQPRCPNRIPETLYARDSAGAEVLAVHQQRIQLHPSVLGQKRTSSSIKGLVVLHHGNRGLNRIDGTRTFFEKRISYRQSMGNAVFVGKYRIVGHRPRATVN
jgi:hypothetical protein